MGPVETVMIAVLVLVPFVAIIAMTSRARGSGPEAFSAAHGVRLTESNRPLIAAYVDRSWRWRVTGALLGAVIPFGTGIPGLEMVAGYLVGALGAELKQPRLDRAAQPAASLTPRSLTDYLAPGVVRALRATALLAVAFAVLYAAAPRRLSLPEHPQVLIASGVAAMVALFVEAALRLVVRRPQPAAAPDLVAADDAIRSASIYAAAGAGLAIVLLLLATELWALGFGSDVQVLRWAAPVLSLAASAGAFVTWSAFGHDRRWLVQRNNSDQVHA